MSNPWKTSWNVLASLALFASSVGLLLGDYRYPGEILFGNSGGLAWLTVFSILWLVLAVFFAIYPKRILFPVLILTGARMGFGFPLNLWMTNNQACLIVSGSLVLVTGIYFLGSIFHFLGLNHRPWFQLKHTVTMIFMGISFMLVSIPFGLGGLVASAQNVFGEYTRFSLTSISLLERVFIKDGKKVFLIGMMHIGEQDFYDELTRKLQGDATGRRIVLTEGVSDKNKILPEGFKNGQTYGKWAKKFGLIVQNSTEKGMSEQEIEARDKKWAKRGIAYMNADIDVSELSGEHQKTLVMILKSFESNNLAEIFQQTDLISGPEMEDLMMDGLLKFRNDRLMEFFDETIKLDVSEIYIPWGAAHLPDIENRLINQGFEKISEEIRPVVRFWKR
ncbi:MAG: hypothetical protein P1V20_20080 [Verrucomicrobiales bacterium]|nr:hypothetical protein [Verrucomicrobiales bacterium]